MSKIGLDILKLDLTSQVHFFPFPNQHWRSLLVIDDPQVIWIVKTFFVFHFFPCIELQLPLSNFGVFIYICIYSYSLFQFECCVNYFCYVYFYYIILSENAIIFQYFLVIVSGQFYSQQSHKFRSSLFVNKYLGVNRGLGCIFLLYLFSWCFWCI